MTKDKLKEDLEVSLDEEILSGLYFPENKGKEIISQISSVLNSSKNIIFTGPPGTGKTEVARRVAEYLAQDEDNPQVTGSQLTTATADWSTFDTVGGYMPSPQENSELEFKPGHILRRLKDESGKMRNELLVIDEINRADIDKAFGQLFTVLSGQEVQLPFKKNNEEGKEEVKIIPAENMDKERGLESHEYIVPESWRILATMNTYDKTSLYEMSYAFMRRFAFIRIEVPDIPDEEEEQIEMLRNYIDSWDSIEVDARDVMKRVMKIWKETNETIPTRKIGPAIVKDMLGYIENNSSDLEAKSKEAVISYIYPQLEGVPERKKIVENIASVFDTEAEKELRSVAKEMLQVKFEEE